MRRERKFCEGILPLSSPASCGELENIVTEKRALFLWQIPDGPASSHDMNFGIRKQT
jgi:hypothetical protein